MQEAPQKDTRRFHVWIEIIKPFTHPGGARLRLGHKQQLTVEPALTHDEACIYLTKQTKYPWRREYLVEVPAEVDEIASAKNCTCKGAFPDAEAQS